MRGGGIQPPNRDRANACRPHWSQKVVRRGAGARDVPDRSRWCKTLRNTTAQTGFEPRRPALETQEADTAPHLQIITPSKRSEAH